MNKFIEWILNLFGASRMPKPDLKREVSDMTLPEVKIPPVRSLRDLYGFLYQIAESETGQTESKTSENGRILQYHDATTLDASEDEVAWCSSFLNFCLINLWMKYLPQRFLSLSYRIPSGIKERFLKSNYPKTEDYLPANEYLGIATLPTFSAAAKSFETWGYELRYPVKGCVVVLKRLPNRLVNRHVAIFDSMTADGRHVMALGGNQGDAVNIRMFKKEHVICYRGFYPDI